MRVCVYLENEEFAKKFGDIGIGNATKNQRKALLTQGIEVTSNYKQDYDVIDINPITFFNAYSIAKYAKNKGKKVVVHVHTLIENFRNSFWFANLISPIMDKKMIKLYNCADLLICLTNYTKNALENIGIKTEKIVIGNSIDITRFETCKGTYHEKYALKGVVVNSVGLVIPRKGITTFINIAKNLPEINFIWFGSFGKGLIKSFSALKLVRNAPQNVIFTGYVEDIVSAYHTGDIFLFPSFSEIQPCVLLEALATKKPIVVRNLHTYDWLENEKNCLKASSDEEFIKKLLNLVENKELSYKLARNGYELVKNYSFENIGEKLKNAYESIL